LLAKLRNLQHLDAPSGGTLLAAALLQTATQPAHALTIRDLATTGDTQYIALEGKFEAGDDRKFVDKILAIERAVIVLDSPGGMADPALAIGRAIRLKGFDTVVRDGSACTSACALVWLAGSSRYMGQTAKLGFHAVFTMEDGRPQEKGAANAVVGAYLAMLGLPTRAIRYVTTAPPHSLSWLSFEEAKNLGIALERAGTGFPPDAAQTKTDPQKDGGQSPPEPRPAPHTDPSTPAPELKSASLSEAISAYQRGDYAAAQRLFLPLAETGDSDAEAYIGVMYAKGEGVPQNYVSALAWLRRSALAANPRGQYNLGYVHANGLGVPKDYGEAIKWYRRAAEQGFALAENNFGLMYANGWGVARDAAQAVYWYQRAASQGNAHGQFNLARMYAAGHGVPKDDTEAFRWFRKASDQGLASAQNGLGFIYAQGRGVLKDYSEALNWFRKAADQGDARAQNNLGTMYRNGWGVQKDPEQAINWYRKAIAQGDALAQANLGSMYSAGSGVAKNFAEAVRLFRKAAEQEHPLGQHYLAYMLYRGQGTPKDVGEAVKWWKRAADQGHVPAQNDFGWMYVQGHGVPKNFVQAYKWFSIAATRADASQAQVRLRAVNNCKHVAAKMTATQIAEAQNLARTWKPTIGTESSIMSAGNREDLLFCSKGGSDVRATRNSSGRNKTESVSARPSGANKCSALQARCAIEAGGTCNSATGHWRYMGYEHAHMRYNDCLSRGLAGR
jgi:TPR repeat protein